MMKDLDRRVAEEVFGLDDPLWKEIPLYSRTISDAWLVVEKMEGGEYQLYLVGPSKGSPVWKCWFTLWEPGIQSWHEGKTAPEAICKAALKAKEK